MVRRADQIELIDSSADQLRRRMLHGNIYPGDKVPAALNGFFRAENLAALRELSLRFVADETEEELLEYLRSKGAAGELWETTERIMVAVTGAPGNASVIRRAARIAARVKAELIAVHVVSSDTEARRSDKEDLEELRQLVTAVGGRWQALEGDDVAKTIFAAAVDQQITQIVVGTSRLTRWQSMTRGSVIQTILRMASENDIDVHVIARRDDGNDRQLAEDDGWDAARSAKAASAANWADTCMHRLRWANALARRGSRARYLASAIGSALPSGLLRPNTAWSTMCSSGRSLMPR